MAAILLLAEDVLAGVRDILRDSVATSANPYRWSDPHLFRHLSRAQREIVRLLPSANPARGSFSLTPGATLQDILPDDAFEILAVPRNMGTDGLQPGRAIVFAQRSYLDAQDPGWHTGRVGTTIENWTQDKDDRLRFYVSPRPPLQGPAVHVEVVYSKVPAHVVALTDHITVSSLYQHPLEVITAAFALQEDTKGANQQAGMALESRGYQMLMGSAAEQQGVDLSKGK